MTISTVDALTASGVSHGWHIIEKRASGYMKNGRMIREEHLSVLEFYRADRSVYIKLNPAGNVEVVKTRTGFHGTVHIYSWVPSGVKQRNQIALDALTDEGVDRKSLQKSQAAHHSWA